MTPLQKNEVEWVSKSGKHYISWYMPEENTPFYKLSDYATLQIENRTAYVSDLKWSKTVREYARTHNIGEIQVVLKSRNFTSGKRGRPPRHLRIDDFGGKQ